MRAIEKSRCVNHFISIWERLQYDNEGVLFLSPSESNSDKFLESFSMRVTPSNMSLSELAESIDNYGQQ
jgi:hypothetical protein